MNAKFWRQDAPGRTLQFKKPGSGVRILIPAVISLCIILSAAPTLAQTTYHVDAASCPVPGTGSQADPFCTIQTAVDAAVSGDTVLVSPGTYSESVFIEDKAITLQSIDGAGVTSIRGDLSTHVVQYAFIDGGSVLDGFTITNGRHGVRVSSARPLVTNCRIVDNHAGFNVGAGMLIQGDAEPTITNCLFLRNTADDRDFNGGAIYISSTSASISDCTFIENHARGGGGIYSKGTGNLTVANSLFERNTVRLAGAGVLAASHGTTTLFNCMFRENLAPQRAGALFYVNGHVDVINCAMINNISGRGTVHNNGGTANFVNCTIAGNTGTTTSAGFTNGGDPSGDSLWNCILWGNRLNGIADQAAQLEAASSIQHSTIQGWDGTLGGVGNHGVDPLLRNLAIGDVRLSAGSLSIDAGSNAALPPTVTTDFDGNPRRVDDPTVADTGAGSPPIVDKGAYEFGDCNNNGVFDGDDVKNGTSGDCDGDTILDECELDCNGNGTPDECDINSGTSNDVNGNSNPDECDPDCNGNDVPDDLDISKGSSGDCDGNGVPDECEDCNGNGLADACDIADGTSQDCDRTRVPDECEECNGNGIADSCDIADGTSNDCNGNEIPDECDVETVSQDCNGNGVPDECEADCNENDLPDQCDIANGSSNDCDGNGVPNECEADCNGNGVPDQCDLNSGFSNDCNGNGIPDECQLDCNSNGLADWCDLDTGFSQDCNGNGVPDECDIASGYSSDCNGNDVPDDCEDCNGNRLADECDVDTGFSADCNSDGVPDECEPDCNRNGIADECDIADGTALDCDGNGLIDECEPCVEPDCSFGRGASANQTTEGCCEPSSPARSVSLEAGGGSSPALTANRFLVFEAGDADLVQALRVTFVDLPSPFDGWSGVSLWVGPPSEVTENSGIINPVPDFASFQSARLTCTPFYRDWSTLGELHVFHEGIVPDGSYRVEVVVQGCDFRFAQNFSDSLTVLNPRHGDIVTDLAERPPSLPSGSVDIVDALAVLNKFANNDGAIRKARADLEPSCLDLQINVSDVLFALGGFSGVPYPYTPTAVSPCDSTCTNPLP